MILGRPSTKNCSNGSGLCISRSQRLKIDFWDENFKNHLVWNQKAWSLDIWYVASTSGPLSSLFKLYPWGQKWSRPGGHIFYIGLYREMWKNLLVWNHKALCLDIWYVASPSGPLPSLFKLCPWGEKWSRPGVMFYMAYIGRYMKKFSCLRPQSLEPWYLVWIIT